MNLNAFCRELHIYLHPNSEMQLVMMGVRGDIVVTSLHLSTNNAIRYAAVTNEYLLAITTSVFVGAHLPP